MAKTSVKKVERPREILTLKQWAADTARRTRLSEILADPVLHDAIESLIQAAALTVPPSVVTGLGANGLPLPAADLNNLLALRFAHRSGFSGAFSALFNLTQAKEIVPKESVFGDLLPDGAPAPEGFDVRTRHRRR